MRLFFIFTSLLFVQTCHGQFQNKLFELKITPTGILNTNYPNILVGAEVYISKKLGVQLEYGIPLTKRFAYQITATPPTERPSEYRLYKRIKGEVKFYTFKKNGFADFFSVGLLHTPQTYTVTNSVTLLNGASVSIPNARMSTIENAVFVNYGGKIWFSSHLFMEYYMGLGGKRVKHRLEAPPENVPSTSSTTIGGGGTFVFGPSERRNSEGDWVRFFVDFGFKFGVSF